MKKQFFWDYLHFTRVERWGIAALLLVCVSSFFIPKLYDRYRSETPTDFSEIAAIHQAAYGDRLARDSMQDLDHPDRIFVFDPNTASLEDFLTLGLSEKTAKSILNYCSKGGKFKQPEDFKKIYTLRSEDFERLRPFIRIGGVKSDADHASIAPALSPVQLFQFDPNTISETDLARLGLPPRTIAGWLHYRDKGGQFRKKEDVKKLYALAESDYQRLEPYLIVAAAATQHPDAPAPYSNGTGWKKTERPISSIDINTAIAENWEALPGIGSGWARRILNFRDKLGGFVSVEQVAETRGLPDSVFQKAKPFLMIQTGVFSKININTATKEDLSKHPYSDFAQARRIIAYREQHGAFQSLADLEQESAFDKKWLHKIVPYLTVK